MKLLVFTSREELSWESCRTISMGLRSAYRHLDQAEIHWVELSPMAFYHKEPGLKSEIRRVAAMIRRLRPDRLVFLDQLPLPPAILLNLLHEIPFEEFPPIFIHVYGDFTYFASEWLSLLSIASSFKLHFIAASQSQKRLLQTLLGAKTSVTVCHFPCTLDMSFDEKLRAKFRSEQGIEKDDKILLYVGRISLQKNVDILIKAFTEHCRRNPNSKWRLWIAGGFDDVGASFLGLATPDGYMNSKIERVLSETPADVRSRIKLWPFMGKASIRAVLSASDLFASLSLYHDEDFGMAPAEALLSGLPCILTDWGGYSSFVSRTNQWDCRLAPVRIVEYGHALDLSPLHQALAGDNSISPEQRRERGEKFKTQFSDKAAAEMLAGQLVHEPPYFGDLGWKFPMFARLVNMKGRALNSDFVPSMGGFYSEVYSSYISSRGVDGHE